MQFFRLVITSIFFLFPSLSFSQPFIRTLEEKKSNLESSVDSLIQLFLDSSAAPGLQVYISMKGEVLLHKAYGYHSYDKKKEVDVKDVYDLASITKIAASTVALMKLHEKGLFNINEPFSTYWPDFNLTDKNDITVKEVLAHYAQLQPYIVFWAKTVKKNGRFKAFTFKADSTKRFPIKTAQNLYLHRHFRKKIYKAIQKSSLLPGKKYVYSGLSFLLYPQIVSNLTGVSFYEFLKKEVYNPLGLSKTGFNPSEFADLSTIVPTEYDSTFRKRMVHGTVHDENAGMFGGISGNAGLFSNASELGRLMEMLCSYGSFQNKKIIDAETVKLFTSYQFPEDSIRRGLGFDKPKFKEKDKGYVAPSASELSFGHSGFTGTFTWADPKYDLVVVLLSNRVHPTRTNRKIYQMSGYRNFHQLVYDELSLGKEDKTVNFK